MAQYYIKFIDGPNGQNGYPNKEKLIHFANGRKKLCEQFKKCSGFLLYETGSKESNKRGARRIYACGFVNSKQPGHCYPIQSRGRSFPYAVKVNLQKIIDPKIGISLDRMREITHVEILRHMGGLLSITKKQFDQLCSELEKCA